jgi:molecular chaperone DnaK
MHLGIDFGTTHTVVSLIDRGNYPVVAFEMGDAVPSLIAIHVESGLMRFGTDAAAVVNDQHWQIVRSFKRYLNDAGLMTEISIGNQSHNLSSLLTSYLANLKKELLYCSNAGIKDGEPLEVAISVPANASSAQRFLTLDAFREAGFDVVALINEPSAAGFEYAHRFSRTVTSKREYVLVYDLGGGTFDASLIHMAGRANEVVTTAGIPHLGGDDFDAAILNLLFESLGEEVSEPNLRAALLEECRQQKEGIGPNARRFVLDLSILEKPPLVLPIEVVYETCAPLVQETLQAIEAITDYPNISWNELAGVYVVGGASNFPLIYRLLRDRFGEHRVRRSLHPFAATAIGLAIYLDEMAGYSLSESLNHYFGVWREAEGGQGVFFDTIFAKDTKLPGPQETPLQVVRRYRAAHNLGHFRFVECGQIQHGEPSSDLTPWDEIRFPFDPSLRAETDLSRVVVSRLVDEGPEIEENYQCSATGILEVTLKILDDGFSRTYTLARRAGARQEKIIV